MIKPVLDVLFAQRDQLRNELTARDIHATNVVVGAQIIVNPPPPDPAAAAEKLYLQRLRARLRRVPLADADEETQDLTLDQLYITLDTRTRVLRETDEPKQRRRASPSPGEETAP